MEKIARITNSGSGTIYHILRQRGIKLRGPGGRRTDWTDGDKAPMKTFDVPDEMLSPRAKRLLVKFGSG